jgi:endoglucanase
MWIYSTVADLYYPGDDITDFIGTTVVNHSTAIKADWAAWRTFAQLFGEEHQAVSDKWKKPMIITEFGSAEQGGDKAAWLTDSLGSLKTRYPLITGVIMLEVTQDREIPEINWSVTSSPAALKAFKEVVSTDYFK